MTETKQNTEHKPSTGFRKLVTGGPAMFVRVSRVLVILVSIVGLCAVDAATAQDPPAVIWASSPVKPGETVLLHGGNFGKTPVIELTSGSKSQTVSPISVSDASIMFVYPETWEAGIVRGRVCSGELVSKPFQLNAPNVWWVHGDRGREASTKLGNLRLIGNCLADPGQSAPQVALRSVTGKEADQPIPLQVLKHNRFSVQTANWDEMPAGTYHVMLRQTGQSEAAIVGEIRLSEKKSEFPADVFDVVQFGAIPSDGIDDTTAILKAVEQLEEERRRSTVLPRGAVPNDADDRASTPLDPARPGADLSQIYWPDTCEPLEALVKGSHSFEVCDIFLTCGNHRDGIVGNWPHPRRSLTPAEKAEYKCGNISIRNVTLRMLYSQFINADMDELKRRLPPLHTTRALRLGGENVAVAGNNIYCAAGGVFEFCASWSTITDNVFSRGNIIGWNGFSGQQLIVENNHLGGANCIAFYHWPEGSENIYWGNNYQENTFDGNNRESMSGDLRTIVYQNTVENITPTSFTTIPGRNKPWLTPSILNTTAEAASPAGQSDIWEKGAVQIAAGKGVGQIRRIKSIQGAKIELAAAWDILPDKTSVMYISSFRRRFIYTENKVYDSSIALQFYGSMIEAIVANNVTARTGGYTGDSNRDLPNWFNQFLDNTIETGLAYRGPRNEVPAKDAHVGFLGSGSEYPVIRSCVIRNNKLNSSAKLDVVGNIVDCLLEKNIVSNAGVGVTIHDDARNIVLSKNVFDAVSKPYEYSSKSVVIRPLEELHSAMEGVCTLLGWKTREAMPVEWREIATNQELVSATAEQLLPVWEKLVRAFARQNRAKPVSEKVVDALLGIRVQTSSWQSAAPKARDGKAGQSSLRVCIPNSRVKAHLKLSVQPEDFPFDGWEFAFPELCLNRGRARKRTRRLRSPREKWGCYEFP